MQLEVYYIDDEEELCENFSDYYSSSEVRVTTFTDPQTAIAYVDKNPPDLLFIDYRLPGTNGDRVASALDPKVPKFLITGDTSFKTKYQFDGVFPKPYDELVVAALIASYLSRKQAA